MIAIPEKMEKRIREEAKRKDLTEEELILNAVYEFFEARSRVQDRNSFEFV